MKIELYHFHTAKTTFPKQKLAQNIGKFETPHFYNSLQTSLQISNKFSQTFDHKTENGG